MKIKKKTEKGTGNVLSWKSKGVYDSKFRPFYSAFLHSIKLSEYRIAIKFDKESLAVEQNTLFMI